MWWLGAVLAALGLALLLSMIGQWVGGAADAKVAEDPERREPPRRGLRITALVLVAIEVVVATLCAFGDANLGPWAVGGGYELLSLICGSALFAALAVALAFWLLATPRAARTVAMRAVIIAAWVVTAGIGCCYSLALGA